MNHEPLYSLHGIFNFLSLNHQDNAYIDQAIFCFSPSKRNALSQAIFNGLLDVFSHCVSFTRMLSAAFRMQKSFLT